MTLELIGLNECVSIKATRDRSDIKLHFPTFKLPNKYLKLCMLHRRGSALLPTINAVRDWSGYNYSISSMFTAVLLRCSFKRVTELQFRDLLSGREASQILWKRIGKCWVFHGGICLGVFLQLLLHFFSASRSANNGSPLLTRILRFTPFGPLSLCPFKARPRLLLLVFKIFYPNLSNTDMTCALG